MTKVVLSASLSVSWQQQIANGFAASHWLRPNSAAYVELLDTNGSNSQGLSVAFHGTFNYPDFLIDGVPLDGVVSSIAIRAATVPFGGIATITKLGGLRLDQLETAMAGAGLEMGEMPNRDNAQAFFDLLDKGRTTINGSQFDDVIEGGKGTDTLRGRNGDDLFLASASMDFIYGGNGEDEVDFSGVTAPVDVSLVSGEAQTVKENSSGVETRKIIAQLNSVEDVTGTRKADVIEGNRFDNRLDGAGAGDVLRGAGGDDVLIGGTGRDKLLGGKGNDRLLGGSKSDRLTGGDGEDQFVFSRADAGTMDRVTDFELGIDTVVFLRTPDTVTLQDQGGDLRLTAQFDATTVVNVLILDAAGASLSDLGL